MDFDSYVKKTAIMGVLKVFYHDPTVIISIFFHYSADSSILDSLSSGIKDSDPLVSINAIMALD
jgi:vesicle coat complex subunit